jgi:hypothetical protein
VIISLIAEHMVISFLMLRGTVFIDVKKRNLLGLAVGWQCTLGYPVAEVRKYLGSAAD